MSKKVQGIGNQYTSEENAKRQRQERLKKVVKKRMFVFGGGLLAVIIVLLIMVGVQMHSNQQASQERQAKEEEYQKIQDEEIELKERLNNLNDDEYIEKIARDEYYLSNDGEVIFKLPEDQKNNQQE
ncbi:MULTISPECIES: septum formation initiator family protein [unclassified Staphylococcus]|uniref:FtsB family cell division protein n=1 Tax=unclassified Staphylococcus TaxID=91994 RepID=UPI0021CE39FF|nr:MULTISPECIES: septum formation initiator family protein [unclassified Staphylococcus]UXR76506.1 septum formation initiator family protein [Staphylococcus sp. IVB6233]UXR80633.1 septum formation initiator family protein [Staphylococcus sp. IVB6218]